eukprot:1211571-Amphidinium_carterae.1
MSIRAEEIIIGTATALFVLRFGGASKGLPLPHDICSPPRFVGVASWWCAPLLVGVHPYGRQASYARRHPAMTSSDSQSRNISVPTKHGTQPVVFQKDSLTIPTKGYVRQIRFTS